MKLLTPKQEKVLAYIECYINEHKFPPTIREIAGSFDFSSKAAYDHVSALKKKHIIKMSRGSRTIEIVKDKEPTDFIDVPVLGEVAAGKHIFPEKNFTGSLRIHESMLKKNNKYFALKVCGDSMDGIGVLDGDIVIIEKRETARNGDIVVVEFDDGGRAIKRFYKQSHRIKLQSENPAYQPIYCMNVCILGRLSGVYRSYS
ncbi:MAG: transcriptional repressor LexA [Spirochaetaceae bacterium]|jgi:repressor LexA|nr:transcriptional repressor LexA [Spirochaetaceae bacterium]GMO26465.1 MAG: transcriptional repressor LexA [Termitinemataceae bacterium]